MKNITAPITLVIFISLNQIHTVLRAGRIPKFMMKEQQVMASTHVLTQGSMILKEVRMIIMLAWYGTYIPLTGSVFSIRIKC
jgi:hypothetical protein